LIAFSLPPVTLEIADGDIAAGLIKGTGVFSDACDRTL
jgi:hypothetical protein